MLRPVLTAAIALLVLVGCGEKPVMPTPPPPAVQVMTVVTEALSVPHEFVGKTVATGDVEIRARVTGTILQSADSPSPPRPGRLRSTGGPDLHVGSYDESCRYRVALGTLAAQ